MFCFCSDNKVDENKSKYVKTVVVGPVEKSTSDATIKAGSCSITPMSGNKQKNVKQKTF